MSVRHQIPIPEMYGDPENERIWCNWDDCGNPASSLHTGVVCYRAGGLRNHSQTPRRPECPECTRVAFCCAQHMDFYFGAHKRGRYGRLSAGLSGRYL